MYYDKNYDKTLRRLKIASLTVVSINFSRIKSLMGFQERSNGKATLHEGRNDLQLVNLCVPPRSAIVVSRSIVTLPDASSSFRMTKNRKLQLRSTHSVNIRSCFSVYSHFVDCHTF